MDSLIKVLKAEHSFPGLTKQQAEGIFSFSRAVHPTIQDKAGIHCLTFKVVGDIWFDLVPEKKSKDAEELVELLKRGAHLTVIRKLAEYHAKVFGYWKERVAVAIQDGVWSYYKDAIGNIEGSMFIAWQKEPDKIFKHQI